MKYYLPIHLDGNNRGCEAITKSTALLLQLRKEDIIALSNNISLDDRLGLSKYVNLISSKKEDVFFKIYRKILSKRYFDFYSKNRITYKFRYDNFINLIDNHDIMLSTGGDMFCYSNNETIYLNEELYRRNIKTILWGCSIGENNLTSEKLETLKHFSLVYVRESLTESLLKNIGVKNVYRFPDPAFILEPEECGLPDCFKGKQVLGLNLSNYVLSNGSLDSAFGNEIIRLIDFLLSETEMNILLIPHVLWSDQDDRIVSSLLCEKYIDADRLFLLKSEELNYCQIRYIISKCRFFIGARTHAVISAYSTKTPALALGYSVKAKGIATDLGLPDYLTIDTLNRSKKDNLLSSFKKMLENEELIRQHLDTVIPSYVNSVYGIKKVLAEIINK